MWDLSPELEESRPLFKRGVCVWDYGSQAVTQTYKDLDDDSQVCFSHRLRLALCCERLEALRDTINLKVGGGVSELKCPKARGYYMVVTFKGRVSLCLLRVGAKSKEQKNDIARAKELAKDVEEWLKSQEDQENDEADEDK